MAKVSERDREIVTQSAQILSHLKAGRTLTSLNALHLFGTLRLAARIWDLRQLGHRVKTQKVALKGGKQIAAYYL